MQVKAGLRVDEEELRRHVAARHAAYKVPVHIRLLDGPLPRNANGKIVKRKLRTHFA